MPQANTVAALVAFETTVILDHNPSIPASNAAYLAVGEVATRLCIPRSTVELCVLMRSAGFLG